MTDPLDLPVGQRVALPNGRVEEATISPDEVRSLAGTASPEQAAAAPVGAEDPEQLVDPGSAFSQVISSIDYGKQEDVRERAWRERWKFAIIDEAHNSSASTRRTRERGEDVLETKRLQLAKRVTSEADHILLLTATPRHGNEDRFAHFLRLLDPDLFPDHHARMVDFVLTEDYINHFLPRQIGTARTSVALTRTVFQRRLASSTGAIQETLKRRLDEQESDLDENAGDRLVDEPNLRGGFARRIPQPRGISRGLDRARRKQDARLRFDTEAILARGEALLGGPA